MISIKAKIKHFNTYNISSLNSNLLMNSNKNSTPIITLSNEKLQAFSPEEHGNEALLLSNKVAQFLTNVVLV